MQEQPGIPRYVYLATFTVMITLGVGGYAWFNPLRSIDRVRPASALHPMAAEALRDAVRDDLPKGTALDVVRRYIANHFADDGGLVFEDTIVNNKSPHPWPPRIRITIREGGHRFAGSHYTRLAFFFNDDGRLDAVNEESDSNYL